MADDIVDAPASPEPTPVDSPVVDPVPEAVDPTPPPETPEPAPAEEKQDGLGDLTDEELNAAIDAAQEILDAAAKKPSKPTNFPEKKEAVALDSDIDALIQQKDTEIEAAKQTAQEATTKMQDVEKAWGMLNQALPDLPDILTKLVSGEENALPIFFQKEFQERLQQDSVLWPLIEAHSKGEQPDYPGFIRGLAASKMKAMPKTSDAEKTPTLPEPTPSGNPGDVLSSRKKTVGFFK